MDSIYGRLKNAFETNGLKEVVRKLYWKMVYVYNGRRITSWVTRKNFEYGLCAEGTRKYQVIVSLTTYPKRFDCIELCLKSLILQNEKPDRIIVYLGSDAVGLELPESMKQFKKFGVEFRYDKTDNLRSHKKYYYAMQEFPESVIVTADDDIIYPQNWLQSLLQSYEKYPNFISARRVHLMVRNADGKLKAYNHWIDQYRKEFNPSHSLIATGNAGILYPPHSIDIRAFDVESIKKLCFGADDIWMKCMAVLKGTKYVWVQNDEVALPEVGEVEETALSKTNVVEHKNDMYLKCVMNHYDITDDMFFR